MKNESGVKGVFWVVNRGEKTGVRNNRDKLENTLN